MAKVIGKGLSAVDSNPAQVSKNQILLLYVQRTMQNGLEVSNLICNK